MKIKTEIEIPARTEEVTIDVKVNHCLSTTLCRLALYFGQDGQFGKYESYDFIEFVTKEMQDFDENYEYEPGRFNLTEWKNVFLQCADIVQNRIDELSKGE
jgi:hypothetical protein